MLLEYGSRSSMISTRRRAGSALGALRAWHRIRAVLLPELFEILLKWRPMTRQVLVLWDIDRTLLYAGISTNECIARSSPI